MSLGKCGQIDLIVCASSMPVVPGDRCEIVLHDQYTMLEITSRHDKTHFIKLKIPNETWQKVADEIEFQKVKADINVRICD